MNIGSLLAKRGALKEALPYFKKAKQLGLPQASQALTLAKQQLFIAANDDGSIEEAFTAFLDAGSFEDLQRAVEHYPYMTIPEFTDSLAEIKSTLQPDSIPAFRQRLELLHQMDDE
jgi:hypothetical protein